ncbi:MAG TPA: hypothetical protein VNL14_18120 [Candidatus Acidoferrales bacterium]|nr:hypothetical protein [Candidatus Acidoferrales bacterium]
MEPAQDAEKLDEHLKEVVRALHGAVNWALTHQKDTEAVDKAVHDCKEILDEIMEGKVQEWLN